MKTLYIVSPDDGSFRKAQSSLIADILDGREVGIISTLILDADGDPKAIALTEPEIDQLRDNLNARRDDELRRALDCVLEGRRRLGAVDGIGMYGYYPTLDLETAPWAEAVVRAWAAANSLHVHDESPPPTGRTWRRSATVRYSAKAWSDAVLSMSWPTVDIIAKDAEIDGRTEDAETIRAEEREPASPAEELAF